MRLHLGIGADHRLCDAHRMHKARAMTHLPSSPHLIGTYELQHGRDQEAADF